MKKKTIDPAPIIKKLADRCLTAKGIECSILGETIDMLKAAPDVTDKKVGSKWIPVTERLPEDDLPVDSDIKGIHVLVAVKRHDGVVYMKVAWRERYLSDTGWRWFIFEPQGSIIYWMPLPNTPEVLK